MPTSTSLLSSDDISQRVHSFKDYYTQLYSSYQIDNVINVDQTPPVWWNGMTSNTRTVAVKNQRSIYTRCPAAANSLEKVPVILACYRDGRKLPPVIIVKSNRSKLQRAEILMIIGVLVFLNRRTLMVNSDIMQRWICLMMPQQSGSKQSDQKVIF
jgi:hypothetical protein